MVYPDFINKNDTIGITAPSDGITKKEKLYRLDSAIKYFSDLGYRIEETKNVRTSLKGRSSSSKARSEQLKILFEKPEVKAIICSGGGDFLLEMLSDFDFSCVLKNPKWLQGYSDPTGLLFTITTNLDIATIYADNFPAFGMKPLDKSLQNNLELLQGNIIKQNSFERYEKENLSYIVGDEPYNLDTNVYWENLNRDEVNITGRMIGGCLDIINDLFGTRFDKTKEFMEKYKNDGIIWYFDNCEFSSEQLIRTLWKLKDNGFFKYTNGIVFGRSMTEASYYDISFKDAVKESLEELDIPIIINTDIGHIPPRMTIINGAIAVISSKNGKGTIEFLLK